MTSKEALERLVKQANARKLSNKIVVNRWCYEKLLELVDRDTPMKVKNKQHGICPNCDQNFSFMHIKYCFECGQRLDWSDHDEEMDRRTKKTCI